MKKLFTILFFIICFTAFSKTEECYKKYKGEWIKVECYIIQLEEFKLKWSNDNSASLSETQKTLLDSIVIPTFKKNTEFKLSFQTYNKESSSSVVSLSERRETSIINYLVSKGVDRARLISVGYGESPSINKYILPELSENKAITLVDIHKNSAIAIPESSNEDIRISKIESYRPDIKTLNVDEKKFKRISFLSENRRTILSKCKLKNNPPTSHRKFNKIQLYAYERIDGSVDLEFFKKLFSPKGKFDNLKISNLNGFYQPVECKCKINEKEYTVGLAWFYGVISSLNINNKSGELKLSALDIISASVTLGRSTVSGKIYGEGLYNDDMNIDFDLSTFSVKEYGNYNIFVKDYLDLRKQIDTKETTFSPTLILLELYELNN